MPGDYIEYGSRIERRRARARERKDRALRRLAWAGSIALVVILGAGGFLAYKFLIARPKPPAPKKYRVTVPEGLTNLQTAEKVEGQCPISAKAFMAATKAGGYQYSFLEGANGNLEGFLFPKTYDVTSDTEAKTLVRTMLKQFGKETKDLDWGSAAALGMSRYQVLIVASLIEKEAKLPEERPVIASVIYNRLKAKVKLQLCSTVEYALGRWKASLSYDDLKVDSPYNTYKVAGLPPGPICNPGFESISAALHPANTNYMYFILTSPGEGRHSFTADYNEFLRWKEQQGQ